MRYRIAIRCKGQNHYYILTHEPVDKTQEHLQMWWNNTPLQISTSSPLIGRRGLKRRYYNLDKLEKRRSVRNTVFLSFSKGAVLTVSLTPEEVELCALFSSLAPW